MSGWDMMPLEVEDQPYFQYIDHLHLFEGQAFFPADMLPLFPLFDGTRSISDIHKFLLNEHNVQIETEVLIQIVQSLQEICLLEGEVYQAVYQRKLNTYRSAPFRSMLLAGQGYPLQARDFRAYLQSFSVNHQEHDAARNHPLKGIISPHIDYQRGGTVYAELWQAAKDRLTGIENVVVIGTDHYGAGEYPVLTRQNYATPLGVLSTDQSAVNKLAEILGEQTAFEHEYNHAVEHSVELALGWAHAAMEGFHPEVLPLLSGSMHRFIQGQTQPDEDRKLKEFLDTLKGYLNENSTLVIAAADLAHVGPAFDTGTADPQVVAEEDRQLLQIIHRGNPSEYMEFFHQNQNHYQVCGVGPIYILLYLLQGETGITVNYNQCPADEAGTSLVSICGTLF